jgi:cyclohexadieny/prephenate dehydrogenase
MPSNKLFNTVALIGIGLIGSSLARAMKQQGLAGKIVCADTNANHRARALELGLVEAAYASPAEAVKEADIVILCVPIGVCGEVTQQLAPALRPGCIVTDTGSVKQTTIRDMAPHIPAGVHFIPGHPIAGTENSGPDAGFAELFTGRWSILTPLPDTDANALSRLKEMWERMGSKVELMDAAHHDRVLAITSHLPHLIAYTIVDTAMTLEGDLQAEVIKYSAGGFRDFTRLAASDPTMWRDIFIANREAVLDIAQRLTEDLTELQKAIRRGEGDKLFEVFTRTRAIRRGVISAKQE